MSPFFCRVRFAKMSKKDKIKEMRGYLLILVIHVIKMTIQKEITGSWQNSIRNSTQKIKQLNIVDKVEIELELEDVLSAAVDYAAGEIYGGIDPESVWEQIDPKLIIVYCKCLLNN